MKRLTTLLLIVITLCISTGYAEQASCVCSCPCCQGAPTVHNNNDETENEPMTYPEWLDLAFPLMKNCYNLSTWVKAGNSRGFDSETREWSHYDVSFLLLDEIKYASSEQIEIMQKIGNNGYSKSEDIINTYKFIHRVPSVCATLRITHAGIVIPDEYRPIDELMMETIGQIEDMRASVVAHIEKNGTMVNWEKDDTALKNNIGKIELLFKFSE